MLPPHDLLVAVAMLNRLWRTATWGSPDRCHAEEIAARDDDAMRAAVRRAVRAVGAGVSVHGPGTGVSGGRGGEPTSTPTEDLET